MTIGKVRRESTYMRWELGICIPHNLYEYYEVIEEKFVLWCEMKMNLRRVGLLNVLKAFLQFHAL